MSWKGFQEWARQYRRGNQLFKKIFDIAPAIENEHRVQTVEYKSAVLESEELTPELEQQLLLAENCDASDIMDEIKILATIPSGEATIPKRERFLVQEEIKESVSPKTRKEKGFKRATRAGKRVYVRTVAMVAEKEAPEDILKAFQEKEGNWKRKNIYIDKELPDKKRASTARNARLTLIMCLGTELVRLEELERTRQDQETEKTT